MESLPFIFEYMIGEVELAEKSFELIKKDLGLSFDFEEMTEDPFARLHELLSHQIRHLLDHDFANLLNVMYRMDVCERKLKNTLNMVEPEKVPSALANVIIERERRKVLTRIKYSS